MSIGAIGGVSTLNQLYTVQQEQAVQAASLDVQTVIGSPDAASGSTDSSANALTGVGASTLDSQTLQALMDLTQEDPTADSDPSQAGATGQATDQPGGAHHHHHHHGGGMGQAQATDASAPASTDAFGVPEPDADSDPLAAALAQA